MYELPNGYGGRLICHFDCAADYPAEQYFQSEGVTVKETALGAYREAPDEALMRFGYRFEVENLDKPYMAVIAYPDDKRRFMCINDSTCYDLSTGVYTGDIYPISNKIKEIHNIFWPRYKECALTFSNVGVGEPAAVLGFSIYELAYLPKEAETSFEGRSFGIQYEDPCGQAFSEGASNFEDWLNRHIEYMHHVGQNRLVYPIVWYHGPQFPSETQPSDTFDWTQSPFDRTQQYVRTTLHPNDWVEQLLNRFDEEKLEFIASMTMLRLGNLMKNMNIDLDKIKNGEPTYNNMRSDNQVQSTTNDWTCEYNMRNHPDLLDWLKEGKSSWDFPYVYGECRGPFAPGPMFNPIHPTVRKQILELISEVTDRYSHHPSLKGISINFWHATILWFASIESGYDDYTVKLFEEENEISLGIEASDYERFSKRAEILKREYREKWIKWRCDKITELILAIRDITLSAGLTLTLNFWSEPSRSSIIGGGEGAQYGAAIDEIELLRQGGIDFNALTAENGIELSVETTLLRDRGKPSGINASLEESRIFHDLGFLDDSWTESLNDAGNPATFLFDCWVECWGEHSKYAADPDNPLLHEIGKLYNKDAEFVFNENCYYPDDGFWWDSQSRITALFPVFPYYIEPAVFAIAKYDTLSITRGGLYLDKSNTIQKQMLSRSFRALPKEKFELVEGRTDPVAVRKLHTDGKFYFYAVNTEPYPIKLSLQLSEKTDVCELWSGKTTAEAECMEIELEPFSLKSFSAACETDISGYTYEIDQSIAEKIKNSADELIDMLKGAEAVAGSEKLAVRVMDAKNNGEYTFIRHAAQSYIALKAQTEKTL